MAFTMITRVVMLTCFLSLAHAQISSKLMNNYAVDRLDTDSEILNMESSSDRFLAAMERAKEWADGNPELLAEIDRQIANHRAPVTHHVVLKTVSRDELEYMEIDHGDLIDFSWSGRAYHNLVETFTKATWEDCAFGMMVSPIIPNPTKEVKNITWSPLRPGVYHLSSTVDGDCTPTEGFFFKVIVNDWRAEMIRDQSQAAKQEQDALTTVGFWDEERAGGCVGAFIETCQLLAGFDVDVVCNPTCMTILKLCPAAQESFPDAELICTAYSEDKVAAALHHFFINGTDCDLRYNELCRTHADLKKGACSPECMAYMNTPECRAAADPFFKNEISMQHVATMQDYCDQSKCMDAGCYVSVDEKTGLYDIHPDRFCEARCSSHFAKQDSCTLLKAKITPQSGFCCSAGVREQENGFEKCVGDNSGMGILMKFHEDYLPELEAKYGGQLKQQDIDWMMSDVESLMERRDGKPLIGYKVFDSDKSLVNSNDFIAQSRAERADVDSDYAAATPSSANVIGTSMFVLAAVLFAALP